jgi:hypothetical protein
MISVVLLCALGRCGAFPESAAPSYSIVVVEGDLRAMIQVVPGEAVNDPINQAPQDKPKIKAECKRLLD